MRDYKDTERVDRRIKEMIKQNVVFVENKAGSLKRVTGILADNGINIYGFACFDAPEFAIFRMICNDPGKNPYHRIVYGLFTSAQEIFSSGNACVSSFFIASIKIYSVP